jgi:hypothetical protein
VSRPSRRSRPAGPTRNQPPGTETIVRTLTAALVEHSAAYRVAERPPGPVVFGSTATARPARLPRWIPHSASSKSPFAALFRRDSRSCSQAGSESSTSGSPQPGTRNAVPFQRRHHAAWRGRLLVLPRPARCGETTSDPAHERVQLGPWEGGREFAFGVRLESRKWLDAGPVGEAVARLDSRRNCGDLNLRESDEGPCRASAASAQRVEAVRLRLLVPRTSHGTKTLRARSGPTWPHRVISWRASRVNTGSHRRRES